MKKEFLGDSYDAVKHLWQETLLEWALGDLACTKCMTQAAITYASEADLLDVALFSQTAKQWRYANPKLEGNMRDYASVEQLLVLANIEGMNAELIHMALPQGDRLKRLNEIAIRQMQVLTAAPAMKKLK